MQINGAVLRGIGEEKLWSASRAQAVEFSENPTHFAGRCFFGTGSGLPDFSRGN